jgi:AcrR family transcriptional regulator
LLLSFVLAQRARRTESRSETQRRILLVSIPLYARRGYDGTSMRDIARAAGIKASSIYEHFSGKEALLHHALVEVLGQFHDFLIDVVDPNEAAEPQLEALVRRHVEWQLRFFDIAGAWDVLVDTQRVAGVLSADASEDIRRRQALYHDVVAALVVALRPGDASAGLKAAALLSLCDRVKSWSEGDGLGETQLASHAWALARAIVVADPPLANHA